MSEFKKVSERPLSSLEEACAAVGIEPPKSQRAGGRAYCRALGGRKNDAGRVFLFRDGAGGIVFNHRTNAEAIFFYDAGHELTPEEKKQIAERRRQAKEEARARERETYLRQEATRGLANQVLGACSLGASSHGYIIKKHLEDMAENLPIIRRDDAQAFINEMNIEQEDGDRQSLMDLTECLLVIPLIDKNGLCSLQFIDEKGQKRFLKGGKKKGAVYFPVPVPDPIPKTIGIAEGVATALSVTRLYGVYCVAGLDSGNLSAAAEHLRHKFRKGPRITIYADDDENETGIKAAKFAAFMDGNADCVLPPFTSNQIELFKKANGGKRPTDFNDYLICLVVKEAA